MRRTATYATGTLLGTLVAVLIGLTLALAGAAAAGGRTVTMSIEDSSGQARLVPASLTVSPGDHVVFRNDGQTGYTVEIARDGYRAFLAPGQETDGAGLNPAPYVVPSTSGSRQVTLTSVTCESGRSGTISVSGASPSPSQTQAQTAAPAGPAATSSNPTSGGHSTRGPVVAPAPRHPRGRAPRTLAVPALSARSPANRSANAPGMQPLMAPTPSVAGSVRPAPLAGGGTLEAPGSRNVGLPAALAGVLIAGVAGALVRVLLAEPVDGRRRTVATTG